MTDCVFCEIVGGTRDRGVIAYEDEYVAVLPSRDQRPTNLGHMLLVTQDHFQNLYEMPSALDGHVMEWLRRAALTVGQAFGASGTSIRQNNGPPGQDVFHVHFHLIPRFPDDRASSAAYETIDLATRIDQAHAFARQLAHAGRLAPSESQRPR
jgi:diadenosine tetraphosphate (Ap4A) HIT family hydrolase